ncbi:hypothetical protein PT2222_220154 [Paraburkholderia tropica]
MMLDQSCSLRLCSATRHLPHAKVGRHCAESGDHASYALDASVSARWGSLEGAGKH